MSTNKKNKRSRGKKQGNGRVSTTRAPTMQGMQQVDTWMVYDLVPVFVQVQSADLNSPVLLQIEAGTNGWNYVLTQGNTVVANESALYGQLTSQFSQLSLLWQTYRIEGIMLEFTPANFAGLGQASPMASIVDAAGLISPVASTAPAFEILSRFSRSRTLQVTTPYAKCTRQLNYHNWMVQTVAEPWLLTQNGQSIDGRQLYPDSAADQRTPVIRFAAQYIAPTPNQVIGFIRVAGKYSVRGRRLGSTTADQIRVLMREAGLKPVDILDVTAGERQDKNGPVSNLAALRF